MNIDPELDALLKGYVVPEPPADAVDRVLQAARPLLRAHAARPDWVRIGRAVAAAVACLPIAVFFDAAVLRGLYAVLSFVLPAGLTFVATAQVALLQLLLLGLTLASIPLLAGASGFSLEVDDD